MYALVTDNKITKFINHPKAMVIGDVQYPAKIFQASLKFNVLPTSCHTAPE